VLVLSATASAINVLYSLRGDPDIELFVTDASRYAPGLYLDGVRACVVPRARDRDRYRLALDAIIGRHSIDVLIATSDRDVEGVTALLAAGWTSPVRMFRPSYEAQQVLANKGRLMSLLARELPDIAPRTLAAGEADRAHELGYPLVAKPTGEGGSRDVAVLHGRGELEVCMRRLRERHGEEFVLQEFIPGDVGSTYVALLLYDQVGTLRAADCMQSTLTYLTWGGGGNAGRMVDEPGMIAWAERIIAVCGGWRGPINFEFRRHARNGRLYVMEGNCRLNGYSYLTTMNGANYPRAMVSLLTGGGLDLPRRPDARCDRTFVLGFREQVVPRWIDVDERS
jgi:predicted ATP-grasp superfamily ATP-dependent carboligase